MGNSPQLSYCHNHQAVACRLYTVYSALYCHLQLSSSPVQRCSLTCSGIARWSRSTVSQTPLLCQRCCYYNSISHQKYDCRIGRWRILNNQPVVLVNPVHKTFWQSSMWLLSLTLSHSFRVTCVLIADETQLLLGLVKAGQKSQQLEGSDQRSYWK